MRKPLFLLTILILLAACCAFAAAEREEHTAGDYTYVVLEDGTAEIAKYSGDAAEVSIPAELDGYPVTGIGEMAFDRLDNLRVIHIPEGIIRIGDKAFYGCDLTSVTIPDSVAYVGVNPFMYCTGLRDIVVSPFHPYLAVIDSVVFSKPDRRLISYPYSLESDVTSYDIPYGTEIIGDYAVISNRFLTSISIPDTVTHIGEDAFFGCVNVTELTIPESVVSIGKSAFARWFALKELTIPSGVTEIEYGVFGECSSLVSLTIPDSVTVIGPFAFNNCTSLQSVVIPESVRLIDEAAFCWCSSLQSVTIPDSVTEIGSSAFQDCTSLPSVQIPDSVTRLGRQAFAGCTSLTALAIPDAVSEIPGSLCFGCTSLADVVIPDSVTVIESEAFYMCSSLTQIALPDGITKIGDNPFSNCEKLTDISVSPDHAYLEMIGGALYSKPDRRLICYPCGMAAKSYTVPDGTRIIGKSAFYGCAFLTGITLPDSVQEIRNDAFMDSDSLRYVIVPESVTEMGYDLFYGSDNVTAVVFPGSYAEQYCKDKNVPYTYYDEDMLLPGEKVNEPIRVPYGTDPEMTREITFSTEMFQQFSKAFHQDLAELSILLSTAAYETGNPWGTNIYNAYNSLGVLDEDIMLFNYVGHRLNHPDFTDEDHFLFSIASRDMGDYTLLMIVMRGSGNFWEKSEDWVSNLEVAYKSSVTTDLKVKVHPGFNDFIGVIYRGIGIYMSEHPEVVRAGKEGRRKVLLTGHSLGGAAADLLGAMIMGGNPILEVKQEDLFVYAFATPRVFYRQNKSTKPATSDCFNIYNIVIDRDIVPELPREGRFDDYWWRFGVTYVCKTTYDVKPLDKFEHHKMQNYINAVFDKKEYTVYQRRWNDVIISNEH